MKKVTLTLEISDNEYDYIVGLNALDSVYFGLPFPFSFETSLSNRVRVLLSNHLARYLHNDKEFYCMALPEMGRGAELEDALECYPALSMELGSDGTTFETPSPEGEPETLISVRDASGVVREVTLDEMEEMREAAQGIYAGEPPEPQDEPDEPDAVSNAEEELSPLTVVMELDKWQLKKLDEFAALRRKSEIVPRPENCYRHEATLQYILRMVSFDAMLEEATALEKERSGCRKEAVSEFWGVELSEDGEAEPDEPDADGEEEELVHITFSITEGNMIHDALFDAGQRVLARRFPHTWTYPVEDESLFNAVWEGDTPMTLTEEECETIVNALFMRACSRAEAGYTTISNELFDLARRISGDDAREEEPETLISVRDASGVVREVTLDEMEEMREAAQGIYAGEPPEPQDEPDEPDADGEEEEPETVSNAEEKPSPLIKDNSDGCFYYLEHGHWPPDDEVLAGADVPCTGDYGLSDCLVVTQSTLDFVDAFFAHD